jgi:hypothetical protein
MRQTSTKSTRKANSPIEKLARKVATLFEGFGRLAPVDQMRAYFRIGREVESVMWGGGYGRDPEAALADLVPQLTDPAQVRVMRYLAGADERDREFFLAQAAIPMSNGQPLSLDHWVWVIYKGPREQEGRRAWQDGELAWIRREAPAGAVMAHIAAVLRGEHDREMEEFRKEVRDALGQLEDLAGM